MTKTVSGEGGSSASLHFGGWYSTSNFESGTEITEDTVITKGMTLYARWQVAYSVDEVSEYADEGSMLQLAVLAEKRVNGKPWIIKDNVRWYRGSMSDGNLQNSDVVMSSDMNNLALVSDVVCYIPILDYNSGKPSDIESYNYSKNESNPAVTVDISSGRLTLPQPTSDKYDFDGWYTCGGAGEEEHKVDDTTRVTDGQTKLVAKWSIKKFKVTFDGNGGSSSSKDVDYGVKMTFPTSERDGWAFDVWKMEDGSSTYTAGSELEITSDKTFKAQWKCGITVVSKIGGSTESYTLSSSQYNTVTIYAIGEICNVWFSNAGSGEIGRETVCPSLKDTSYEYVYSSIVKTSGETSEELSIESQPIENIFVRNGDTITITSQKEAKATN